VRILTDEVVIHMYRNEVLRMIVRSDPVQTQCDLLRHRHSLKPQPILWTFICKALSSVPNDNRHRIGVSESLTDGRDCKVRSCAKRQKGSVGRLATHGTLGVLVPGTVALYDWQMDEGGSKPLADWRLLGVQNEGYRPPLAAFSTGLSPAHLCTSTSPTHATII
jgi:hypothetical protein